MNVPILVRALDRQFTATLIGSPDISAVGATREEAIAGLRQVVKAIERMLAKGRRTGNCDARSDERSLAPNCRVRTVAV